MNKESNVINKWVDIGVLPIYKKGRKNTYINWDDSIGIAVPFVYGDICGNATILKNVDSKRIAIYVDGYTSEDGYIINKPSFVSALFGNIFKQKIIDSAPYITPYLNNIKEHDIEVVRIDCAYTHVKERFDYIKKHIINSRFSTIFDLSSIDWRECEKFASSSILIDVCNLWDESNYNIKEISKIVHLSHHVVSSYLKVGERIGICTFNDKEKHYRSNKHHGHPVYVYKNDVLIKRFDSIRQCVDKSIETFGVKFDFKCVLNAYNGKRESYKGYIFKRSEEVNNTKLLKGVY